MSFPCRLRRQEKERAWHLRPLDPKTDGRPDPRPDVRENVSILGNLLADFDFSQSPRQAMILPLNPAPGPAST